MKFMQEFKVFIMRGSVLDLAIGIIIGAAFTSIVNSLVNDLLMPPIGMLLGRVDFSSLFIALDGKGYTSLTAAQAAGAPTLNYGLFINNIINFLIIAFVVFLVVRWVNRLKPDVPARIEEPATKGCPYCLSSIPVKASRCPHCTSELTIETAAATT